MLQFIGLIKKEAFAQNNSWLLYCKMFSFSSFYSFFFISWWHFGIWRVCDNGRDMTAAILTSYIVQKMGTHTHWQRRNIRMALLKSAGFFCSRCCFSPPSTVRFNFDARRDLQATKQTRSNFFHCRDEIRSLRSFTRLTDWWNKILWVIYFFLR